MRSTSFLNNVFICAVAVLVCVSGCAHAGSAAIDGSSPDHGTFRMAVLPLENLCGKGGPLREIQESLVNKLKACGLVLLDDASLEQFMTRHRVRYTGGMNASVAKAFKEEVGVSGVLITTLEYYDEINPPKIALISRLVSTGDKPVILWMESIGVSGDDSPGILGLGLIEDPKKVIEKSVTFLTDSLAGYHSGKQFKTTSLKGKKKYQAEIFYRSPALGLDLNETAVSFAQRSSRGNKGAGLAKLYVVLSSVSGRKVSVDYAVTGGTARGGGEDYTLKSGTLIFNPGETVKAIEGAIKDNKLYEDDKTIEVMLSNPRHAVLGEFKSHTYIIVNDTPKPSVAFAEPARSVKENAGRVTVPVKLSAVSGKEVTVPFSIGGTAGEGPNYKALTPSPLVIKAGATGADITVNIIDNGIYEDDKTIVLSLGRPANAVPGNHTAHTVTVVNNDPPPAAAFTQGSSRGDETVSPAKLEVSLSTVSGKMAMADYAVTGGTARNGVNYILKNGTLTFNPGETVKTIEIEIKDSGVYDDDKTVAVTLSNPRGAVLGNAGTHVYTIANKHSMPAVAFEERARSVKENAGTVTIPVRLSAASGKDVVVPFTIGGTAKEQSDYSVVTPNPLVIKAGRTSGNISVIVQNIPLYEDDKTVVLSLGKPTNAVPGAHTEHTLTVVNDDPPPTVAFTQESSRGDETVSPAKLEVSLSTASGKKAMVDYAVTGGTARSGVNYASKAGTLTFNPGETMKAIELEIKDSGVCDDDKTVEVTLSNPRDAVLGNARTHTYTVANKHPMPAVTFAEAFRSVKESAGTVTIPVRLSAVSGKDVIAPFTAGGTAAEGSNYRIATASPLTIKAGTIAAEIQITLMDNKINEEDKTLVLTLGAPTNAVPGPKPTHTLTIVDTDPSPAAAFLQKSSGGKAGASPAKLDVGLSTVSGKKVTVDYAVTGGTARSGKDYFLKSGTLSFNPGETMKAIEVDIKQSTLHDDDKTIEVSLSKPANAVLGAAAVHTYTIVNTAPIPAVAFASGNSRGEEGVNLARLYVALSLVSGKKATVNYAVTGGTARSGVDYSLKAGTLTFNPGETMKAIELEIKDGGVYDDDKTVEVTLSNPVNAVPGEIKTHTYTISNKHPMPTVTFSAPSRSVKENAGKVTIPMKLSAMSRKDVTVPFSISGTATDQINYKVITPSPLVIKAGAISAEIAVDIVDDGINEDDKTVMFAMGTPVNATAGAYMTNTVTIADNDPSPAVAFARGNSRGDEKVSPAKLEVSLSSASGKKVAINYAVTGGTARNGGVDYSLDSGTLTFNPGETRKAIEVAIKDNSLYEDDKTVEVALSDPVNAVLGGVKTHTYTIVNDDPLPEVTFGDAAQSVKENGGVVTVAVKLSSVSGKDAAVPFSISGTAQEQADYEVITSSPIVIKAGMTSADITMTIAARTIIGDRVKDREDRTIILTMGIPIHAAPGIHTRHIITIVGRDPRPRVVVMPFFNISARRNAGEILMLHFVKHLVQLENLTVVEPGDVRQKLLNMRVIMQEGISKPEADLVSNALDADLIFIGRVSDYQDAPPGSRGVPKVDFTATVISKKDKKIIWASKSYSRGDDGVVLFDWGKISTANSLAGEMTRAITDTITQQ